MVEVKVIKTSLVSDINLDILNNVLNKMYKEKWHLLGPVQYTASNGIDYALATLQRYNP